VPVTVTGETRYVVATDNAMEVLSTIRALEVQVLKKVQGPN